MKMKMKMVLLAVVVLSIPACSPTASSGPTASATSMAPVGDLSSFVGARAGQAELGLQDMGYQVVRTQGLTAYWFNTSNGSCAEIVTSDGRYSSVTMLPAGDC